MQASKTSPAFGRVVRSCLGLGVAVSLVMLPPLTDCWSPMARFRSDTSAPGPPCYRSRATRTGRVDTSILMSPASSEKPKLLAQEGDWAAYFDENFGKVYYFNHETGKNRASLLPSYLPTQLWPSLTFNTEQVKACGRLLPRPFQGCPKMLRLAKIRGRKGPYHPSKTFTRFFMSREQRRELKSSNPIWLLRSNTINSIRVTDETRNSTTSPERGWS